MLYGLYNYIYIAADTCSSSGFLNFTAWYKYLPTETIAGKCSPVIKSLNDIWLIVAAVIDILLQVAAIMAVAYIIYGGFSYITSQGEPDKTAKSRNVIINGLIGLVIAISAASIIGFVARSIK